MGTGWAAGAELLGVFGAAFTTPCYQPCGFPVPKINSGNRQDQGRLFQFKVEKVG
jgi:hypothetical protein